VRVVVPPGRRCRSEWNGQRKFLLKPFLSAARCSTRAARWLLRYPHSTARTDHAVRERGSAAGAGRRPASWRYRTARKRPRRLPASRASTEIGRPNLHQQPTDISFAARWKWQLMHDDADRRPAQRPADINHKPHPGGIAIGRQMQLTYVEVFEAGRQPRRHLPRLSSNRQVAFRMPPSHSAHTSGSPAASHNTPSAMPTSSCRVAVQS